MLPLLPDDVLHLITLELWQDHDFQTLFNCALTSKRFAVPAVAALYRMHEIAPVTYRGRNDELARSSLEEVVVLTTKWSNLWKSMILSSVGETVFPYCHYSRALDLKDLEYLFDDSQFAGKLLQSFFSDLKGVIKSKPTARFRHLWIKPTVQAIGNALIQKSPLIEELSGNIDTTSLRTWIPQLKKLRKLQLWQGVAIEGLGPTIRTECPNFAVCELYNWTETGDDGDKPLADFLNDLEAQSLRSFRFIGRSQIGAGTLCALGSNHGSTLTELVLTDMPSAAISELGLLKGCTRLQSLQLSESFASVDLVRSQPGVYDEVVNWLRLCGRSLRRVKLGKFPSGASILTPLFMDNSLELEELELSGYSQDSSPAFFDAIRSQAESLRELLLKGEQEDDPTRIMGMVEGVSTLRRLKVLHLKTISELFRDAHITVVASSLRQLEEISIAGWGVTDQIFDALAGLHSLRRADLLSIGKFSFDGIMAYIAELGKGNEGLVLALYMADPQFPLSDHEQMVIRQTILDKVGGRFEYNLVRDLNESEYSSDSD